MRPALDEGRRTWSAVELAGASADAAALLRRGGTRILATVLDNTPAFVALDEGALAASVVHVPLPLFFTPAQMQHALQSAGVDTVLAAPAFSARWPGLPWAVVTVAGETMACARLPAVTVALPAGTVKITFTSGTTGTPKGVCLGAETLQRVTAGLMEAMAPLGIERHLNALPFAVLLENVAGLTAPRRQGATVITLPLAEVGLSGSSSFEPARLQAAVRVHRPNSLIVLPQMLRAWCAHLAATGQRAPDSLRMVAVGGAAVGAPLIDAARALGIPAFEGYGLSEGASVQTLNLPGADRPGSAGRPLPHARVRVAADGELEVAGSLFSGYLGDPRPVPSWWPTGDLGHVDADGYVHVSGRKKHLLITAYGRNVSPEWVETALRSQGALAQAVVFGDGQPALSAVLWPSDPAADDPTLQRAVDAANAGLPDYAHIARWVRAAHAFDVHAGMATANGRPRRDAVLQAHAAVLAGAADASRPGAVSLSKTKPSTSTAPSGPQTMNFHAELLARTAAAREGLLAAPIIQGCLRGQVSLPSYLAFLREAYHHVRHTVPLLQAMRAALPAHQAWLLPALDEYIEEEAGHDEWILDDIRACGGDAEAVRQGLPGHATEVMVAYAYDTIARRNPLGFFGMVHVLEGTSVSLALMAADAIQKPLGLPDAAFSYLRSHGTLDQEHTAHFALLMDQIEDPADQAAIVHAARAFFQLYGDVFRSLPLPQPLPAAPSVQPPVAVPEAVA